MTQSTTRKRKPTQENTMLVCPSCLTRYKYDESESPGQVKLCDYCRVPLLREKQSRGELRCFRCMKRIITPRGVWCTHFNKQPTPQEAADCKRFEARAGTPRRRARRSA